MLCTEESRYWWKAEGIKFSVAGDTGNVETFDKLPQAKLRFSARAICILNY